MKLLPCKLAATRPLPSNEGCGPLYVDVDGFQVGMPLCLGWGQVGSKRRDPWYGRPTRYAMRQTTVGLAPFTYFPCCLLTSKKPQEMYCLPHKKYHSPTMSTPTPASMVPATQPLTSDRMRSKHPTQGHCPNMGSNVTVTQPLAD